MMKTFSRQFIAVLFLVFGGAGWLPPARAVWPEDAREAVYTAELNRARQQATQSAAVQRRLKETLAGSLAALEAEIGGARQEIGALQSQLVTVLSQDDPAALKAAQAAIMAVQIRLEAAEAENALCLKQIEEAGRETEAWKKRAGTFDLALRLDSRILLAAPAEVEARQKKIDAAEKEVEFQQSQIRKYYSRREQARAAWLNYRERLAETRQALAVLARRKPATGWHNKQAAALAAGASQLTRLIRLEAEWFLLNRELERRSRRNLAFARSDFQVIQTYAAGLAQKQGLQDAAEAKTAAEESERRTSRIRKALDARLSAIQLEIAKATAEANTALAALARGDSPELQTRHRSDYNLAVDNRGRWEAQADFTREFMAYLKAVAAYSREKADKARTLTELNTLRDITLEMQSQRENRQTSEQYIKSFKALLEKISGQMETARHSLNLPDTAIAATVKQVEDTVAELLHNRPEAIQSLEGRLLILTEKLAKSSGVDDGSRRRQWLAAQFVMRTAQRALTQERLVIAQDWVGNTREFLRNLGHRASVMLWEQRDPRLTTPALADLGTMIGGVLSDALFAGEVYWLKLAAKAGYPGPFMLGLALLVTVGLAGLGGWFHRQCRPVSDLRGWYCGQRLPALPAMVFGGLFLFYFCRANAFLYLAGIGALLFSLWWLLHSLLLGSCRDRTFPSRQTLSGAVLAGLRLALNSVVVLLAVGLLGATAENPWNSREILFRAWIFFVWLAAFRLVLHPLLLGRFLSRRSENRLLRWFGAGLAWACVMAAIVAMIPYLFALDNLGQTVLMAVLLSLFFLVLGIVFCLASGWILKRLPMIDKIPQIAGFSVTRLLQALIIFVAGSAIAGIWWHLLRRIFFSANAPAAVQGSMGFLLKGWQVALALWHRELTAGMTVSSLFRGLLVFVLSFWVAAVVKRVFLERVLSRTPMDETTRQTFASVLGYVVVVVGFLVALNAAGSSLKNLALLAGAITVGLGFGLQNVINNFVSSLLIHFGRSLRVGDYIEVAGQRGKVQEIGLRNTMLFTDDGVTILVPNGAFISANIINWTNPTPRTRIHIPVTVLRAADLSRVTQLLTGVALENPLVLKKPAPALEVRAVAADRISVELLVWTDKPEKQATLVGELALEADRRLRDAGLV